MVLSMHRKHQIAKGAHDEDPCGNVDFARACHLKYVVTGGACCCKLGTCLSVCRAPQVRHNTALVILLDANFYADVNGVEAALKLEALDCAAHARACQVSGPHSRACCGRGRRRPCSAMRMHKRVDHRVVPSALDAQGRALSVRLGRPSFAGRSCIYAAAYLLLFMRSNIANR